MQLTDLANHEMCLLNREEKQNESLQNRFLTKIVFITKVLLGRRRWDVAKW